MAKHNTPAAKIELCIYCGEEAPDGSIWEGQDLLDGSDRWACPTCHAEEAGQAWSAEDEERAALLMERVYEGAPEESEDLGF